MYSVFTKVITELSVVDILREYCNLQSSKFGDAQSAYANLCDHFSGGEITHVTVTQLETKLTTMRLNRQWNKTVTAFVTHISQLIRDHCELTNGLNGDEYYIEKLPAMFEEHKDMLSHLQTLDSQEKIIQRWLGVKLMTHTKSWSCLR